MLCKWVIKEGSVSDKEVKYRVISGYFWKVISGSLKIGQYIQNFESKNSLLAVV